MDEMTEALTWGHVKLKSYWARWSPGRSPKNRTFAQCLHNILVNVWVTGEVPEQWKGAIVIKVLHKKKDRRDSNHTTETFHLLATQTKSR